MLWTLWLQQKVSLMSLQNPPEQIPSGLLQQHNLALREKANISASLIATFLNSFQYFTALNFHSSLNINILINQFWILDLQRNCCNRVRQRLYVSPLQLLCLERDQLARMEWTWETVLQHQEQRTSLDYCSVVPILMDLIPTFKTFPFIPCHSNLTSPLFGTTPDLLLSWSHLYKHQTSCSNAV